MRAQLLSRDITQEKWVKKLRKAKKYKMRVQAAKKLVRYKNVYTIQALFKSLNNRKEHSSVRGEAALSLAHLNVSYALHDIKRVARSRKKNLRRKARKALKILCPKRLNDKLFYIHIAKINVEGKHKRYTQHAILFYISKLLKKRPDTALLWSYCRKPRSWMIRKKKMKGLTLNIRAVLETSAKYTRLRSYFLWSTFPQKNIRLANNASAAIPIFSTPNRISLLASHIAQILQQDFHNFFEHHKKILLKKFDILPPPIQ